MGGVDNHWAGSWFFKFTHVFLPIICTRKQGDLKEASMPILSDHDDRQALNDKLFASWLENGHGAGKGLHVLRLLIMLLPLQQLLTVACKILLAVM